MRYFAGSEGGPLLSWVPNPPPAQGPLFPSSYDSILPIAIGDQNSCQLFNWERNMAGVLLIFNLGGGEEFSRKSPRTVKGNQTKTHQREALGHGNLFAKICTFLENMGFPDSQKSSQRVSKTWRPLKKCIFPGNTHLFKTYALSRGFSRVSTGKWW